MLHLHMLEQDQAHSSLTILAEGMDLGSHCSWGDRERNLRSGYLVFSMLWGCSRSLPVTASAGNQQEEGEPRTRTIIVLLCTPLYQPLLTEASWFPWLSRGAWVPTCVIRFRGCWALLE